MILWLVVVVARKVAKFQTSITLLLKVSEGLWVGGGHELKATNSL